MTVEDTFAKLVGRRASEVEAICDFRSASIVIGRGKAESFWCIES
jgi:hypothetical protein